MALAEHQERVLNEKAELDARLEKLNTFMALNATYAGLPPEEQLRLVRQQAAMTVYSAILGERIAAW